MDDSEWSDWMSEVDRYEQEEEHTLHALRNGVSPLDIQGYSETYTEKYRKVYNDSQLYVIGTGVFSYSGGMWVNAGSRA